MDIVITEFKNRIKPVGNVVHTTWEDLVNRLSHPVVTEESLDEYAAMTNEQKTDVKDCGGYVAGEFENGRRKKDLLKSRYVLTIDADDATPNDIEEFQFYEEPWMFCVHSTHTSTAENPRLRWLFLLSRPVAANEYRHLIKYVSKYVGAETLDETTDQPERLMFWPSVSWDADYTFLSGGTEPLPVDQILGDLDLEEEEPERTIHRDEDGLIPEGYRNEAVFRYAAKQREEGLDGEALLQVVNIYNETKCRTPLRPFEIKTIIGSVLRYPKGEAVPFNARDIESDFSDIGTVGKKKFRKPLENGNELRERYIPPAVYLVDEMVTTGLGMVVAPPKFGKSWFALDLALSIATGTPFFGKRTTRAGVLYYALEDNDRRVQRRMNQVSGEERKDLSWFYHTEDAPTMGEGLFEEIDDYLDMYPEIKFVVIDTLQKVRPPAKRSEGAYANDYNDAGKIQKYALSRDLSILLVHHTRKIIDPNDLIGNISGTNGLSGAIDYAFGMSKKKWDDDQAKLEITGRDISKQTYMMAFNNFTCRWENLGTEKEVREDAEETSYNNDPLVKTIKFYLDQAKAETQDDPVVWKVSTSDLADIAVSFGADKEESSLKVGMRLAAVKKLLEAKDGITCGKGHTKDGNVNVFSRKRK